MRKKSVPGILITVAALAGAASPALAQSATSPLPAYQPAEQVSGTVRIWGHGHRDRNLIGPLVKAWEDGFRRHHPGVEFATRLKGDKSAIGGLYTGAADLAIMERTLSAIERDGCEQIFGHDPLEISVATGSLDVRDHGMALAIFVHKDNPISKLTLAQVDAIFGADHRRGARDSIRTWGELGLGGEWAGKAINAYGFAIDAEPSQYFQNVVMGGSQKWSGNLHEFAATRNAAGTEIEAGQQIVGALARDRHGIAISGLAYADPRVKALALATTDEGPWYEATRETVGQRTYPLARPIFVFLDRAPGRPIEARLKEYLRYILSREGQEDIDRDGGYIPLTPEIAQQEQRKLD